MIDRNACCLYMYLTSSLLILEGSSRESWLELKTLEGIEPENARRQICNRVHVRCAGR